MKVDKLVPEVYYRESRDYSYVGRLLEVVFNYMKTASDNARIHLNPTDTPAMIVELMALTLGFSIKHDYALKDLIALIEVFQTILRNKGSKKAVELLVTTLLTSQGIENIKNIEVNDHELTLVIPRTMTDVVLLEDVFDYILPVGMTYHIVLSEQLANKVDDTVVVSHSLYANTTSKNSDLGQVSTKSNSEQYSAEPETLVERSSFYTGAVVTDKDN